MMLRRSAALALALLLALLPAAAWANDGGDAEAHIIYRARWRVPPRIFRRTDLSDWRFIRPEATENMVLNPSAEAAGNYAALVGAIASRSTTYSKWGVRSYRVQTVADNDGISLTLSALTNAIHYVTVWVRGTLPTAWDWSLDNIAYTAPAAVMEIDDNWTIYGLQFSAAEANGATLLYIRQNGAGAGDFYLDGIQVEAKSYWTTYCDGDQDGCEWNGAAHGSTSDRSAQSRAGGRLVDFEDDYHFDVGGMIGAGNVPQDLEVDMYALLPGGELNSVKMTDRTLSLPGVIRGTTWEQFHGYKQNLVEELAPERYPKDAYGYQPLRLWYTGAEVVKELKAHYLGGMEGAVSAEGDPCFWERLVLRFICPDPFWYEIGESSDTLDEQDSLTFRLVARRVRDTGQWDDMGPPDPLGTYTHINDIVEGQDGTIYIAGDITNFDNDADADYFVTYDPETDTFSPANATPLNNQLYALAVGPDGTIYLGGAFTNAGGDGDADYFCQMDPDTGVFSSVNATPLGVSQVRAIAIGGDGTIYIGGTFTDAGGDVNADFVCQVDASTGAYSSLNAAPLDPGSVVYALAVDVPNQILYIGGDFTNASGDADADYICQYDIAAGGAFTALTNTPLSALVYGVAVDGTGQVFLGGNFTDAGGDTNADYLCRYNGTAFVALGTSVNDTVWEIVIARTGDVYVGGIFTEAGGLTLGDRIARWNGEAWAHLDLDLPGSPTVRAIHLSNYDPVVPTNYDIYVGFNTTGAGDLAGDTTITNPGTAHLYPTIQIAASGGSDRVLESIRNETTGMELLFDYTLLDGETLTIYLEPTRRRIVSSFFGPRPDALLPNSDLAGFSLQPGDNLVTCFVD